MKPTPRVVRDATVLWIAAVAAGVAETAIVVASSQGVDPGMWANVALRVVVYGAAGFLVANFAKGRRWARMGLTVLLSAIGLATLVVPAGTAMIDGQSLVQAFSDGGQLGPVFLVVRLTHIVSVVAATVMMFTPSANGYFATPRAATSITT